MITPAAAAPSAAVLAATMDTASAAESAALIPVAVAAATGTEHSAGYTTSSRVVCRVLLAISSADKLTASATVLPAAVPHKLTQPIWLCFKAAGFVTVDFDWQ